jgi:hypothetical protein
MHLTIRLFLLCLVISSSPVALAQETVAFYFAAHEDDWQLFMSPNAYRDTQSPSTKVVFVYLTAGDGGSGMGNAGRSQPYYLARENGAKLSVMFIANGPNNPVTASDSETSIGGHTIKRWTYGPTVSYFLRLPDGNMDGDGYDSTGLQSLRRLHEGAIQSITAIDASATYRGWDDLTRTLRDLIDRERGHATKVWVNVPDTDVTKNPGDHSDHQQSQRSARGRSRAIVHQHDLLSGLRRGDARREREFAGPRHQRSLLCSGGTGPEHDGPPEQLG